MATPVRFSSLKLNDASRIRSLELLSDGSVNLTDVRSSIRQILSASGNKAWLLTCDGQEGDCSIVVAFDTIDPATAGWAIFRSYPETSVLPPDMLQQTCLRAFTEFGLYRLEARIPIEMEGKIHAFRSAGFNQDGILRSAAYDFKTKRHQDIILLSLLRPEYLSRFTAFIPFKLGVFNVTGHDRGLTSADFARYGERFQSAIVQESAEYTGLLDPNGCLASSASIEKVLQPDGRLVRTDAPQTVQNAARQVQEYFAGHLTAFDLSLDLTGGSEFQIKVWNALSRIPFGTTWTYEELAHQLTEDDWQAARNMARAVGSACGANPIPLILPCHRVIGKDGRLVGFSGGLDIKEYLLDHELMGLY